MEMTMKISRRGIMCSYLGSAGVWRKHETDGVPWWSAQPRPIDSSKPRIRNIAYVFHQSLTSTSRNFAWKDLCHHSLFVTLFLFQVTAHWLPMCRPDRLHRPPPHWKILSRDECTFFQAHISEASNAVTPPTICTTQVRSHASALSPSWPQNYRVSPLGIILTMPAATFASRDKHSLSGRVSGPNEAPRKPATGTSTTTRCHPDPGCLVPLPGNASLAAKPPNGVIRMLERRRYGGVR